MLFYFQETVQNEINAQMTFVHKKQKQSLDR